MESSPTEQMHRRSGTQFMSLLLIINYLYSSVLKYLFITYTFHVPQLSHDVCNYLVDTALEGEKRNWELESNKQSLARNAQQYSFIQLASKETLLTLLSLKNYRRSTSLLLNLSYPLMNYSILQYKNFSNKQIVNECDTVAVRRLVC